MTIQEQQVGAWAGLPTVGFVARLKLLRASSVLAVLDPDALPVPGKPMTVNKGGVLVEVGAPFTELIMPPAQATFKQEELVDSNGSYFALSIDAALRATPDLLYFLLTNRGRRWVAIWIDLTGQPYIAGAPDAGLTLQHQRSLTATNTLQFSLRGRSLNPAWYLESFSALDLFPDAAFDHSFELSFDA